MKTPKFWMAISLYMVLAACGTENSPKKEKKETNCVNCEIQKSAEGSPAPSQTETKTLPPTPVEVATAQEAATNPKAGKGFLTINSDEIPGPVKKAALSIFHLVVLNHATEEKPLFLDVSTADLFNQAKEKIKASQAKDFMERLEMKVVLRLLSVCAASADVKIAMQCPVPNTFHHLTAFLGNSGDELWTNAHGFRDAFLPVGKTIEQEIQDLLTDENKVLSAYVFDGAGTLVGNPLKEAIRLAEAPEMTPVAQFRQSFYAEDSDYVRLKISKKIGPPLTISKSPLRLGQKVFVAGYPTKTTDRGDGKDSDGETLKFSVGNLLDGALLWESFFEMKQESQAVYKMENMLFYSADSENGSSGSPLLNDLGEVIGIHTGGKTKQTDQGPKRISRGVRPLSFKLSGKN